MRSLVCCRDDLHNYRYVNSERELLIYGIKRIFEVGDVVMREERRNLRKLNGRRALSLQESLDEPMNGHE